MPAVAKNPEPAKARSFPFTAVLVSAVLTMVLCFSAVAVTLFVTGYFDADSNSLAADGVDADGGAQPELQASSSAEPPETQYYEIPRPLTANIAESRKVMQISVAVMTHFDKSVLENVAKHELAIRSAMLAVMAKVNERGMADPAFKDRLAEDMQVATNAVLEQYENFGGVEKVLFSEFLVQ